MEFKKQILENLDLGKDDYSIPFNEVVRLTTFFKYGDPKRVAILLIALTGCRISEINNIYVNSFYNNFVVWKKGKNQKGSRKEKLPIWFINELIYYIDNERKAKGLKLFSFKSSYLTDYINKKVRPILKGNWIKKRPIQRGNQFGFSYIYQIKGLRHNFFTLDFANNMEKWGKDLAIEFTAKGRHSSYKMTARHYIQNFDSLNINDYINKSMGEILKHSTQTKLMEYDKFSN